jgi:hypothetical protein
VRFLSSSLSFLEFCIPKCKLGLSLKKSVRTHRTLSTPFVYCPRARPARGIPPRLEPAKISPGLRSTSEWRTHGNQIAARVPGSSSPRDITCKVIKRSLSLSVCLLPKTLTLTQITDLYARVARAVYASRDPVPYHVHGARARLGNAPHLPALASGRCAWPRMLADSGAATSQRRCKVCLSFPHTPQISPPPPPQIIINK